MGYYQSNRCTNAFCSGVSVALRFQMRCALETISAQLEKVDWAALEQSTGDMLAQAQKSLAAAEEALTAVNDAAEKLDVEGLNTAVTELLAVMQPLAEFFARFK